MSLGTLFDSEAEWMYDAIKKWKGISTHKT